MKISETIDVDVVDETCVEITEHTEDGEDVYVIIEPDEIYSVIRALIWAHLTLRAADFGYWLRKTMESFGFRQNR